MAAILLLLAGTAGQSTAADATEPGFEVVTYAEDFTFPSALAAAPDGRLFVAQQTGEIWIVAADGTRQEAPFAELEVYARFECGLLGISVDPDFEQNRYVYVFATVDEKEQQVIRLTDQDGVAADPAVIRRFLPTSGDKHNGGCLKFGPDGKLYFSIGDVGEPPMAQQLNSLAGKVCRINADGSTPDDNPFATTTGAPRAVYASGFRNPFRFCFAPDGRLFVMDVGSDNEERREEINLVRAGDNCGWPVVEGFAPAGAFPEYVDPIYAYHDEGSSISGGVYYTGTQFPDEYAGDLFHAEYVLNRIYRTVLDGDAVVSHTVFVQGEGGPVDLVQAPDGSLFYCEVIGGTVRQIRYVGGSPGSAPADGQSEPNTDPEASNDTGDVDSAPPPAPWPCGFGLFGSTLITAGFCAGLKSSGRTGNRSAAPPSFREA